jgi:outer membrane lipoprotein-sorting protein
MMRAIRVGTLLSLAMGCCCAQTAPDVLARLNRFAPSLRALRASVHYTEHIAAVPELDTHETGTFMIQRSSPGKLLLMIDFTGADANTVVLRGETVEQYYPKLDEIKVYDIRKYRDLTQRLLLLGFGMSGRDLQSNYEIRDVRHDTVESQPVTHLELVPKAAEVLKQLKRVEIWIADQNDCAVLQKLYFPGGDYKIAQFSNVEVNPKIDASSFDLPKHAKRVRVN